jgi:hypothetical protein
MFLRGDARAVGQCGAQTTSILTGGFSLLARGYFLNPKIATQFRGQPAVVRCSTVIDKADSVKMFTLAMLSKDCC